MHDLIVKNGTVIDPARDFFGRRDIYVKDSVFVEGRQEDTATRCIDADGCYVAPGLVDAHIHVYPGASQLGGMADLVCPPNCVTTAIDAGSAGLDNIHGFYRDRLHWSTTVKATVAACPGGVLGPPHEEVQDPAYATPEVMRPLFRKYGDFLVGIKQRVHSGVTGRWRLSALRQARDTARILRDEGHRCRLMVHFGPLADDIAVEDVVGLLDPGDVLTHIYRPADGSTIFGGDGRVLDCVKRARERGVVFESGCARSHCSFESVRKAFADHFPPAIISTDMVKYTFYWSPSGWMMLKLSMYLNSGMELSEVVRAASYTPASVYGLLDEAGTLEPGRPADIAVFRVEDRPFVLDDIYGGSLRMETLCVPMATVKAGVPTFQQVYLGR